MKPLLSVAIATKDREKYCIAAIQSILDYDDDRLEITIADNSSTTLVKDFVEKVNSCKVKYFYDDSEISSNQNFNRAVELTTGEYVIVIGDDDSILPNAVEVAKWASENNIDSICSKKIVTYYWPGALKQFPTGHLIIPQGTTFKTQVNLKTELESLIKNGLQHYLLFSLPKTYHGIVKKEVLNKIKSQTGHFYGGLSPDTYSCIAVSCIAKNHYLIDHPITIAGICATSTTADNFTGKHSGSLKNIPHLKNRPNYVWHKMVPKYYSVNTIWAESGLKALDELRRDDLLSKFNIHQLFILGWINNRKYISDLVKVETEKTRIENSISKPTFYFKVLKSFTKIIMQKVVRELQNKLVKNKSYFHNGVINIQSAIDIYKNQ